MLKLSWYLRLKAAKSSIWFVKIELQFVKRLLLIQSFDCAISFHYSKNTERKVETSFFQRWVDLRCSFLSQLFHGCSTGEGSPKLMLNRFDFECFFKKFDGARGEDPWRKTNRTYLYVWEKEDCRFSTSYARANNKKVKWQIHAR